MRTVALLALLSMPSAPVWAADAAVPGIPKFHQVNEHIYRGGQPARDSWKDLAQLGVKTVIDLTHKGEHAGALEAEAVEAAGMRYVNVPMSGLVAPSDEQVSKVLALLEASSADPIFVHCKRGADRTGTVIACYRIAHDRWPSLKALQEAESYGMSVIELSMKRYILSFHP